MSDRATAWAWQQRGLTPSVKLALVALAREADLDGCFTFRRREIGVMLECSLDTVDRRVKALEAAGLLAVERRSQKGGFQASQYTLAIPQKFVCEGSRISAASPVAPSRSNAATVAAEMRPWVAAPVAASNKARGKDNLLKVVESHPDRFVLTAPEPRRTRRAKFKRDEEMTNGMREVAARHGFLNGRGEAAYQRCRAHHAAKGTLFDDKEAAFENWLLNDIRFSEEKNGKPTGAHAARPATAAERERLATESRRRGFAAALARHELGLREEPQHMAGEADGDGFARASGGRLAITDASGPAQNRGGG